MRIGRRRRRSEAAAGNEPAASISSDTAAPAQCDSAQINASSAINTKTTRAKQRDNNDEERLAHCDRPQREEEGADDEEEDEDDEEDEEVDEEEEDFYNSDDMETGASYEQARGAGQRRRQSDFQVSIDDDESTNVNYQRRSSEFGRTSDNNHGGELAALRAAANSAKQQHFKTRGSDGTAATGASTNTATHYNTVNDSWFINYNGIIVILPIIFNAFQDEQLERAYQRYSHGQRQKSLVIAHLIDLLLKLALIALPLLHFGHRLVPTASNPIPLSEDRHSLFSANVTTHSSSNSSDISPAGLFMVPTGLFGSNLAQFSIDSLIFDDLKQFNWTHGDVQMSIGRRRQQMQLFTGSLLFGPLASGLQNFSQRILVRNQSVDGDDEFIRVSPAILLRKTFLVQNWKIYQLPLLFSTFNILIILTCSCVPHRYLTNKLSYLALITWFLMSLQSYLVYNSNEMGKQETIDRLDLVELRPIVSSLCLHFPNKS